MKLPDKISIYPKIILGDCDFEQCVGAEHPHTAQNRNFLEYYSTIEASIQAPMGPARTFTERSTRPQLKIAASRDPIFPK